MEYDKLTIPKMKELLDAKGIDYSSARKRDDYISILKESEENTPVVEKEGLVQLVKSSLKVEKTVVKSEENTTAYLKGKDYSELTAGERQIIRQQSPQYNSVTSGITVKVTDRLVTAWRIVKLADLSYSKLLRGESYVLSQEDFNVLENEQVKVKTEATKNKCCGQAVYEQIPLLEVVND